MHMNLDTAPCFYLCADDDGIIIDVNETTCLNLGYSRENLVGHHQDIIFTIASRIYQQTHLLPLLLLQSNADEILISLKAKNGDKISVLFNIQRTVMLPHAQNIYVGIRMSQRKEYEDKLLMEKRVAEDALRENSALKKVKDELQSQVEELDRQIITVNRQASELRQFNKVVTHDLQEPFRKLLLFASLLKTDRDLPTTLEITGRMMLAAKKAEMIVSGLQQYVWLIESSLNKGRVNFNELLADVVQQTRRKYPDVNLLISAEDFPPVEADKEQMRFLLQQLLSNVAKFHKPGEHARVNFTATILKLNKFKNTADKYAYQDFIRFRLEDDGIGFEEIYTEQVFELFKTVHANSGIGIGLSLCRKIVEHHGGSISIESAEGKGTIVTFILPV